jgi:hypothetical protein
MSLLVDEKLKIYKSLQIEIQKLYGQKQQSLSQLNENVLVKGVRHCSTLNAQFYDSIVMIGNGLPQTRVESFQVGGTCIVECGT